MAEEPPAAEAKTQVEPAEGADKKKHRHNAKDVQNMANAKYTRQGNAELTALTGREPEFAELGDFTTLYEGLATHARQHVNPLQHHLQVPTQAPKWEDLYADATLPLQIDIGCGSGRFVLLRGRRMASGEHPAGAWESPPNAATGSGKPRANLLGLEIREKLVERAQAWSERMGLRNCKFLFTNATVSFKSLLASYPGPIELVSMQFPDPHFKRKHWKRRHVQPQLVKEIAELMKTGAHVFLQGDVPEAVRWMRDMFERHSPGAWELSPLCRDGATGLFREEWETPLTADGEEAAMESGEEGDAAAEGADGKQDGTKKRKRVHDIEPLQQAASPLKWSGDATAGWLKDSPVVCPTEREVYVGKANMPVYRVVIRRI
eukprot:TRINITY_DN12247_c0_g1_i1.p1 TRINITY_DN12247_c0_g1~~TRINITY_DN12247_c0_g1_i1.p1  ORF type:complete len:376 (+),score=101.20 TRINITY_DN12247_c0_g1_i1:75-1202(+)